jgi:tetratricopeptide (TPR) repeat protein
MVIIIVVVICYFLFSWIWNRNRDKHFKIKDDKIIGYKDQFENKVSTKASTFDLQFDHRFEANKFILMATSCKDNGDLASAISHLWNAIEIYTKNGDNDINSIVFKMSSYLELDGKYQEAYEMLQGLFGAKRYDWVKQPDLSGFKCIYDKIRVISKKNNAKEYLTSATMVLILSGLLDRELDVSYRHDAESPNSVFKYYREDLTEAFNITTKHKKDHPWFPKLTALAKEVVDSTDRSSFDRLEIEYRIRNIVNANI